MQNKDEDISEPRNPVNEVPLKTLSAAAPIHPIRPQIDCRSKILDIPTTPVFDFFN